MNEFLYGFLSGIIFLLLLVYIVAKYKGNALTVGATKFLQQMSANRTKYYVKRLNKQKDESCKGK